MAKKLRILNLDEARRLATTHGLTPVKIPAHEKHDTSYSFSKLKSGTRKPLTWSELEMLLFKNSMVICEIGGYMKIIKKASDPENR